MKNRTTAIILTVISAVLCGCLSLIACVAGVMVVAGVPFTTTVNGYASSQTFPVGYGVGGICASVILIAIPIIVGVLTLRKKKNLENATVDVKPGEPLPPAS